MSTFDDVKYYPRYNEMRDFEEFLDDLANEMIEDEDDADDGEFYVESF